MEKFKDSPFQISREGKRPLMANNGPVAHSFTHVHSFEGNKGKGLARESTLHKGGVVNVHPGMHERQVAGMGVGGMGSARTAPDASSANPLAPEAPVKQFADVKTTPGMRSRTGDALHSGKQVNALGNDIDHVLGRRILDEALSNSNADDRMAHGRPMKKD